MVRWYVSGLACMLIAAGCLEDPSATETGGPSPTFGAADGNNTTEPMLTGTLVATLSNATVNVSQPFNVTIAYDGDNITDLALVAWHVAIVSNETGNATQHNGTGLPATISANITQPGNHTITGNATLGNQTIELVETWLIALGSSDPCDGAAPQAPIEASGLWDAAAVDGTGLYVPVAFTVEACQTKILAEVTTNEAYLDAMLRLKDPSGASVDEEDNEFLYHETLTYEPGGILEAGEWTLDLRGYAGGPGSYELVITFA